MRLVAKISLLLALVPSLLNAAEKYNYFLQAGFSPVTGAFEGRYQVSEQACQKMLCYRFAYDEQAKLARVDYVIDGKFPFYDKSPRLKVESREGVQKFTALNPQGVPVKIETANDEENNQNAAETMKNFEDKDLWQYQVRLDEKGRVTSFSNLDRWGKLVENRKKYAQFAYSLDDAGRIVLMKIYNQHYGKVGPCQLLVEYRQSDDRLVQKGTMEVVEPDKQSLKEDENGIAITRLEFDARGNLREAQFFGLDGQPKNKRDEGAAVIRYQYDERGNLVEQSFFGPDQRPVDSRKEKAALVKYKYDEQGRLVEKDYCGGSGKLKKGKNGVSMEKTVYNDQGQALEISFLDAGSRPIDNKKYQAAKLISKFDASGNIIEQKYLNKDGKLRGPQYVPVYRMKYDAQANLVELAFYGKNDQPVEPRKEKVAVVRFSYDNLGGIGEVGFYDKKGNLKERADLKIAGMQMKRDRQGCLLDVKYFDQNRKLKSYSQEVFKTAAEIRFLYDSRGLVISGTYFDPYGIEILR